MKQHTIIAVGFLASLVWLGCSSDPQTAPPSPAPPKVEEPAVEPAAPDASHLPAGLRTLVYTIGHPWHGVASTEWQLSEEFVHDSAGHELYHKAHFSNLEECKTTTYDATGHEVSAHFQSTNPADEADFKSTWSPDFLLQTTEEHARQDGRVVAVTKSRYDAQGHLLSQETVDNHVPDLTQKTKMRQVFDGKGRLTQTFELVNGKEILGTQNSYDGKGNCFKIEHFDAEGKPSQTETFTFDGQGHKLDRHLEDRSAYRSNSQLTTRFEYNAQGQLAKELHYSGQCDANGEKAGRCTLVETISFTYDDQGRIATEVREKTGGQQFAKMQKRYEYSVVAPNSASEASRSAK